MAERWLPVVGYEGRYEVSDKGRVRSLLRGQPYVLKPITGSYLRVSLHRQGLRSERIHLLVLPAFVGPRPPGLEGCHGDGDPWNNRLSNLRWDTPSENAQDRLRHGRHSARDKVTCPVGHLLVMPNLYLARWERLSQRECLACRRGRSTAKNARRDRGISLDFRPLADEHYEKIMEFAG